MTRIRSDTWDSGNSMTRFYECEDVCNKCDENGTVVCPECEGNPQPEFNCGCTNGRIVCPECSGTKKLFWYE